MNILIIEDERVAARRLERLLREILRDRTCSIHLCETLESSQTYLANNAIDLLFLDLNLNGKDGFTILQNIVAESFQTIVVSANTDRAIEAFDYGVLDFIPKPFDKERLVKAFQRLDHSTSSFAYSAKVVAVKNHGTIILVPVDTILFFKGAGDYTQIYLQEGSPVLHTKSLESLEKILPKRFVRIHKSYIVDFSQIVKINVLGGGKYTCELKSGTLLPVSRTRYKEVSACLKC